MPNSYRVSVAGVVSPASGANVFTAQTGVSYQYDFPSPYNPPFLTAADDDMVFDDCWLENEQGHAQFGHDGSQSVVVGQSAFVTTVAYNGNVANPLAVPLLKIGWNVTQTITILGPHSVNIHVFGGVTCFPAHQVLFQGVPVAWFLPTSSDPLYTGPCLASPQILYAPLVGPATLPGGITVPY